MGRASSGYGARYRRARAGEIRNFTGISAPYEMPEAPELDTQKLAPQAGVAAALQLLQARGVIKSPNP